MGAGVLSFRVRDGSGRVLPAMTTETFVWGVWCASPPGGVLPVHSLVGVSARPRLVVVGGGVCRVSLCCCVSVLLWCVVVVVVVCVGGLVVGRIVDAGRVCVVAWVVCVVSAG